MISVFLYRFLFWTKMDRNIDSKKLGDISASKNRFISSDIVSYFNLKKKA